MDFEQLLWRCCAVSVRRSEELLMSQTQLRPNFHFIQYLVSLKDCIRRLVTQCCDNQAPGGASVLANDKPLLSSLLTDTSHCLQLESNNVRVRV